MPPPADAVEGKYPMSLPTFAWWFTALFAVTQVPLYAITYPDITDFPNHLARLQVSMDLAQNPVLQRFYELRPAEFGTNLAMDLLVPLLALWTGPALALKLFTSLAVLAFTTGAAALGRAVTGRFSPLLLGVLLFAQNAMFHYGLLNYLFGAGAALWLLAAWIASSRMHWSLRWLAFSLGAAFLYACHLSGLGIFAVGIVAHEAAVLCKAPGNLACAGGRHLLLAVGVLLPVAVVYLGAKNAAGSYVPASTADVPVAAMIVYKGAIALLATATSVSGYALGQTVVGSSLAAGLIIGLKSSALEVSSKARWIAGSLALVAALLPSSGFGSNMVDIRLVPMALLCFWCGLSPAGRLAAAWRLVAGAIAVAVALITVETGWEWGRREAAHEQLRGGLAKVPEGASLALVSLGDPKDSVPISPQAAAYAVIDRSVFLSSFYVWPYLPFPLAYREPYASQAALGRTENPTPSPTPYAEIEQVYDHVLVYGADAEARRRYAPDADTVFEAASFRLVRTRLAGPG